MLSNKITGKGGWSKVTLDKGLTQQKFISTCVHVYMNLQRCVYVQILAYFLKTPPRDPHASSI